MYIQIFLSKQERSGVRGLHTGDTGIVNFFRLSASADPLTSTKPL